MPGHLDRRPTPSRRRRARSPSRRRSSSACGRTPHAVELHRRRGYRDWSARAARSAVGRGIGSASWLSVRATTRATARHRAGGRVRSRRRSAPTPSPAIAAGEPLFDGVLGYEQTVMPQLENALLAGHDVIFLGERGQAKTRMIRSLTGLLDEWMPIVAGSEINDDPYHPVSRYARDLVAELGDDTADRLGAPRPSLRREAGHARHVDRRPDRRGRPDQGRRGPLPLRRAHAALRARAAHEPRHLRHQRAPRPRRADPGRHAQRARGARRPGPRLQDPPAARRDARRLAPTRRTTPTAAASSRR